jgi:uncharacterized protein DUF4956
MTYLRCTLIVLLLTAPAALIAHQPPPPTAARPGLTADQEEQADKNAKDQDTKKPKRGDVLEDTPDASTQMEQLQHALMRLPIAAGLATVLALRPRRRGTPPRQSPVIQTQIILAVVGAVVMLVVGSSLARAFGIVGAAGLVRYRSKIEDPRDAGVMLSTLAIGLASGVGLWLLALFATAFVLALLWTIESFEKATTLFALKVKAKDLPATRTEVEKLLQRHRLKYELRNVSPEEIWYDVQVPVGRKTDRLSEQILDFDRENVSAQWEEKKEKK